MTDLIVEYRKLLKAKKDLELLLVKEEAVLAEKVSKKDEHLKKILLEYGVESLEKLQELSAQKELEATQIISDIKKVVELKGS